MIGIQRPKNFSMMSGVLFVSGALLCFSTKALATSVQPVQDYKIATCKSGVAGGLSWYLKVSLAAVKAIGGQFKPSAFVVSGQVHGEFVSVRLPIVSVDYNYDVEPGGDSYFGTQYFDFVTAGDLPRSVSGVTISYTEDTEVAKVSLRLREKSLAELLGTDLSCELFNRVSVLENLDI